MTTRFLGGFAALLAGSGLALAEAPAFPELAPGNAPPPAASAPAAAPAAPADSSAEGRSPYWPNPLAKLECLTGSCQTPATPGCAAGGDEWNRGQVWADADYLLWWVKKGPLSVPLATTGTTSNGVLGAADTKVLYGGSGVDYDAFSGGRINAGFWFDKDHTWGLEGGGFVLENRPVSFDQTSSASGAPVLARPVINALTGQETAELISAPGVAAGELFITSHSQFYGADLNFLDNLYRTESTHLDVLIGYRFLTLNEQLNIDSSSVLLPGGSAGFGGNALSGSTTFSVSDQFATQNVFNGGQLGARFGYTGDQFFVNFLGKIALGDSHETVSINGSTQQTPPGGTTTSVPGGLLALSSNIGRYTKDEFAAVPELGINFGYQINPLVRAYVGYSFIYLSDVARPGDQINRSVNPALVPTSTTYGTASTPAAPGFTFQRTEFWAQGVNFGLEVRY